MSEVCEFVQKILGDISRGNYHEPSLFCGKLHYLALYSDYGDKTEWSVDLTDCVFWTSVVVRRGSERRHKDVAVQLNSLEKRLLKRAIREVEKKVKDDMKILCHRARNLNW